MFFKRKRKLMWIGKYVAVDPRSITALYKKYDSMLIIRIGVGIIEVSDDQLFKSVDETIIDLYQAANK